MCFRQRSKKDIFVEDWEVLDLEVFVLIILQLERVVAFTIDGEQMVVVKVGCKFHYENSKKCDLIEVQIVYLQDGARGTNVGVYQ